MGKKQEEDLPEVEAVISTKKTKKQKISKKNEEEEPCNLFEIYKKLKVLMK